MAGAFPTPGTWATAEDLPPEATPELQATIGPATITLALSIASTVLYNLTDQRWPGPVTRTIYPRSCRCATRPAGRGGCTLDLRGAAGVPVTSVGQVTIDGAVISPDRYELQDDRYLVWLDVDGDDTRTCWPCHQDLDEPIGGDGTWSVVVVDGRPVPADAVAMAGRLGWELALLMSPAGHASCRLSSKTQSAARRGASQRQIDPARLIELGATSLPEVDLWLRSITRGRARRGAAVRRPGGAARPGHTRAG